MIVGIGENGLDDDAESGRNVPLGSDSHDIVGQAKYFKIQVLLAVLVLATPINVPLPISGLGPVQLLAFN